MSEDLTLRVSSEYREMPGLVLTLAQACRLWQVDRHRCEAVLEGLVREGLLARTPQGFYVSNDVRQRPPGQFQSATGRPA